MSYYIKGGSNFDTGAAAKAWMALHRAGFPTADYADLTWKEIAVSGVAGDPFYLLGGAGGDDEAEFGLYDDYRIRITDAGIWGWHEGDQEWYSLFGDGEGPGGVNDHGLLAGLDDNDHPFYFLSGTQTLSGILSSIDDSGATSISGTIEGQLWYDDGSDAMYRWQTGSELVVEEQVV